MSRKTFLILFAAWLSQGPAAEAQTPATFSFNTNCFTTTTNYFYVREEQTNAFIRVNRCGDTSGTVSVHYATRDGTATAGLDYVTTSGTLTFSPGETEAGFSVPIIFDDVAESIETVNLTLSDPTGGAVLGPVSTAVLGIADSSPFIQIGFSSTAFAVSETDSSALVTVSRQGSTSRTVTVQFAASTGSATAGLDFIGTNGTLTFSPGETVKTFSVPLLNDGLAEPTETVSLTLSNPSGGATLGQSYATLFINDAGVQFSQSDFQVTENAGAAAITVSLGGTYTNVVTVDYSTSDGTAKASVDYTATSGTLTFSPGRTNATFSVPIINDSLPGGTRTVNLTLISPTGASLSIQTNAVVYINDNDFLSLDAPSDVNEDDGAVTVNARRTGDTDSPLTVVYFTSDGVPPEYCCPRPAKAGVDYLSAGGSLTFAPGETNKTFTILILDNGRVDGDRVFSASLIYRSNLASQIQITIHDNEIPAIVDLSFNPGDGFSSQFFGNGQVFALALQPDGKIVIGGSFDTAEDVGRTNVARVNADGSLDTNFVASTSLADQLGNAAQVSVVALQTNGQILIGGNFTAVNDANRGGLARLNPDGSLDTNFNVSITLTNQVTDQNGNSISATLKAMAVQPDGKVIIGGTFDTVNGIGRTNLARLNADGSLDTSFVAKTELMLYLSYPWDPFNPNAVPATVSALTLQPDSPIIVGGQFTSVNGAARTSIARLNQNGSLDDNFFVGDGVENGDNPGIVRTILWQPDGTVVLGGQFTSVHGVGRIGVVRLYPDGNLDSSFNPAQGTDVKALTARNDGLVFIAEGECRREGGCHFLIKRLNPDGSVDDAFPPVSGGGRVEAMALDPGGEVIIAGSFQDINVNGDPIYRPNIARLQGNPAQPRVQFDDGYATGSGAYVNVSENSDTVTIAVQRLGDSFNGLTVNYSTSDGTAKAGLDYAAVNATLTFAPLEITKTITLPLLRGAVSRGPVAFNVVLSSPTGGLLGRLRQITVSIPHNMPDPGLDAAIRAALLKPEGLLSVQDLLSLTRLEANAWGVRNLEGLQAAQNLTTLDLSANQLTSLLVPAELTNLSMLILYNNSLTGLIVPAELRNLTALVLYDNELTSLALPAGLTNLATLYLSDNRLTNFALPPGMVNLTTLELYNNQLTNLIVPEGLTNLTTVYLGDNRLTSLALPEGLTRLAYLDLHNNQLTNLTLPAALPRLAYLDLHNNQLASLALPARLPSLATLNLYSNQLTSITLSERLTNLTALYLQNNHLASLTIPAGPVNLTTLDLYHNQITSLTLPAGLTNLISPNFTDNPLNSLVLSETLAATGWAGWVSFLRSQGVSVYTYPLAVTLGTGQPVDRTFGLTLSGPPAPYTIFSSIDLASWIELGTLTNRYGAAAFTDPQTNLLPQKFYRAVSR